MSVAEKAKPKSLLPVLGCALLVGGALSAGAASLGWFLRDTIAASILDSSLRQRGVVCEAISIQSTSFMGEITLAPSSCALSHDAISRVTWQEPIVLERSGFGVSAVRATQLQLTRTPRPTDAQAAAWGVLGDVLHGPEQVGALLILASRVSRMPSTPSLEVRQMDVIVENAAHPEMTLRDLRVAARTEQSPVEAHLASIALAPIQGPLGVTMRPSVDDVAIRAEATSGVIGGELQTGVSLPVFGTLSSRHHVEVIGEALDQEVPRWRLR